MLYRRLAGATLALLLLSGAAQADARGPAPAALCLDARLVTEVRQARADTLAIALSDGGRFRVALGADCPGVAASSTSSLLAREGWVCGTGNEYAQVDDRLCPVAAVARIEPAEYAALARASHTDAEGTTTLDKVVVRAEQRRGFVSSPNYCFSPRHLLGWSEDEEGLIAELNPRRAGGNRYYRVELAGACPELAGAASVRMHSGLGIGVICGNPGDAVFVVGDSSPGFEVRGRDRLQAMGAKFGCPIRAVHPMVVGLAIGHR